MIFKVGDNARVKKAGKIVRADAGINAYSIEGCSIAWKASELEPIEEVCEPPKCKGTTLQCTDCGQRSAWVKGHGEKPEGKYIVRYCGKHSEICGSKEEAMEVATAKGMEGNTGVKIYPAGEPIELEWKLEEK